MTENQSVLAAQRAEDQALCQKLRAMYSHRGDGTPTQQTNPDGWEAATRIEQLSQELAEASHDRDRYQADIERLREHAQRQPV